MSSLAKNQSFQAQTNPNPDRDRFLRFPLNSQIDCLVSLAELIGVIDINLTKILPVPQIEEYWLGIINWRGEAVWILDLAKVLGAKKWYEGEKPPKSAVAILVGQKDCTIGTIVQQANTIETYNLDELLPVSSATIEQEIKFVRGYFLDDRKQPVILLDIKTTIQDTLKH